MKRHLLTSILILVLSAACFCVATARRTSSQVRKEQRQNTSQLRQARQDLEANRIKADRQLKELNSLTARINQKKKEVEGIRAEVRQTSERIDAVEDSIKANTARLEQLRRDYARSLRQARTTRQKMSGTALLFSSRSIYDATRRMDYLKQIDKSRKALNASLVERAAALETQKDNLEKLRGQLNRRIAMLEAETKSLEAQQTELDTVIASLRQQTKALQAALDENQRRAKALEDELQAVIEQEQREEAERLERERAEAARREAERLEAERLAAEQRAQADKDKKKDSKKDSKKKDKKKDNKKQDKKGTQPQPAAPANNLVAEAAPRADAAKPAATFAAGKGNLPFPVSGRYTVVGTFGRSKHTDLQYVEVDNPGIDIETTAGAHAKAVYPGTVSSIFQMSGYHNIVMVRHGEYLTVYANIDQLAVKKGDTVAVGQDLGHIYSDASDGDRTILHFEVRREREKLNPLDWVKQ